LILSFYKNKIKGFPEKDITLKKHEIIVDKIIKGK